MTPLKSYVGIGERKKVIFSDDLTKIKDTAPENGLRERFFIHGKTRWRVYSLDWNNPPNGITYKIETNKKQIIYATRTGTPPSKNQ